jgi:hypothetical protein
MIIEIGGITVNTASYFHPINAESEVLSMYDHASFNQVNNRTNRCNNN